MDEVKMEEEQLPDETTITLERDLENSLISKLDALEEDLKIYEGETGRQFQVQSGRIDILAQDKDKNFVVLELKVGTATESVLAQVLAYMADVTKEMSKEKPVRGIIIAHDFAERLVAAASLLPTVKLMKYKVYFEFEEVASVSSPTLCIKSTLE
jgi:RecB family endonuclease NucS